MMYIFSISFVGELMLQLDNEQRSSYCMTHFQFFLFNFLSLISRQCHTVISLFYFPILSYQMYNRSCMAIFI